MEPDKTTPGVRGPIGASAVSIALIATILGLPAAHVDRYVGPSPLAYFVAIGTPQAAIIVGLRSSQLRGALALAGGVAVIMTLLSASYSALGFLMASWNFGGYGPPEWYWTQWLAACVLMVAQICLGWTSFAALRRLTSTWYALASIFGCTAAAFLYLVSIFVLFRITD